jgi:integration host factor subunit beta
LLFSLRLKFAAGLSKARHFKGGKMHKSQLVVALSTEAKISHANAETVVETFFNCIENGLVIGERTEIRGLGSFRLKRYKGYLGRNPKTGESIEVPPKRMPFFRVGRDLKSIVAVDEGAEGEKGKKQRKKRD